MSYFFLFRPLDPRMPLADLHALVEHVLDLIDNGKFTSKYAQTCPFCANNQSQQQDRRLRLLKSCVTNLFAATPREDLSHLFNVDGKAFEEFTMTLKMVLHKKV